ncbi:MAG: type I 3-dehydroquinate dehydratase [Syntrophobacteraceae bacterium]|jgi:3-dehydroquinate dehydratase type I|nr:type I 3-dehydroquinate dehydratase [Syntrophobacteraceae bacterium]
MNARLCGCFVDTVLERLHSAMRQPGIALLEWRLDLFLSARSRGETLEALKLLGEPGRLPVLVTHRPVREGGGFEGAEDERIEILEKAVEAGAEWVDLEWDAPPDALHRCRSLGASALVSHHDFSSTPDEGTLRHWVERMAACDAQALKLVTHAHSPEDNLRVLGLIPWALRELDRPLIAFCMGPLGQWSRLACLVLGSPWTYVQLPGQVAAAPGQLLLDDAEALWRLFAPAPLHRDRAGLKSMESQLQQADKLASIGQLASGIAHEINNPLGLILGYTQLLLRDEKEGSERLEDLRIIEKHARACKTVVRDLLSFSRSTPSRKGPGHLHHCIREILGVVRHPFELDGVGIEITLDDTMPAMVMDEAKIKQVVMNLIMNAKQAIENKGTVGVVTRFDRQAGKGVLEVRDTGRGIPPEHLPRIFDPFFTTKEPGEGTGLGLSVSYGIVQDHGGEISVESEPERGSTFTVVLPVGEEPRESA